MKSPLREDAHDWETSRIPVHGKAGPSGVIWLLIFTSNPPFLCCAYLGMLNICCFSVMPHQCAGPVSQCPFNSGWWQLGVKTLEVAIRIPGMEQSVAVLLLIGNLIDKKIKFVLSYTSTGGLGLL